MTLDELLIVLRERTNGSVHGWAKRHGLPPSYAADVLARRKPPGPRILRALGFHKEYIKDKPGDSSQ
jgi:hypothetical protein